MRLRDATLEAERQGRKSVPKSPQLYMPALRWKKGEIDALTHLRGDPRAETMMPMILVDNAKERGQSETPSAKAAIPSDPKRYLESHIAKELQRLHDRRYYLDTSLFDKAQVDEGREPFGLEILFGSPPFQFSENAVPVLKIGDTSARREALREVVSKRGAAIRLTREDLAKPIEVVTLLKDVRTEMAAVDVIIDLGNVADASLFAPAGDVTKALVTATTWTEWKSVIVLAGSYPKKPEKFVGPTFYPRHCWLAYQKIAVAIERENGVRPKFGDYGIMNAGANPTSGSQSGGGGLPIIRYCLDDSWAVFRALSWGEGLSPYFELTRKCAGYVQFMGGQFSFGDRFIEERARGENYSPGNTSGWLAADISHHVMMALTQVAGGPLAFKPVPAPELKPPPRQLEDLDDAPGLFDL